MLQTLSIRHIVLIDALDLEIPAGLLAMTGETGAGKSIVLDALGLALGARADAGLVRAGTEQASVSAAFMVPEGHPALDVLAVQGLVDTQDPQHIRLRRTLSRDGKHRAFVNDQPVGVGILRQFADLLVDMHGQFETHALMDAKTHAATLDQYAGLEAQLAAVRQCWQAWRTLIQARTALEAEMQAAQREQLYWQQALEELEALAPEPDEETRLVERRAVLQSMTQLLQGFAEARDHIEGDGGAITGLNRALRILERISAKAGPRLDPVVETLGRAVDELREASELLTHWFEGADDGPDTLEAIDDRLHALRAAARKYQVPCVGLPDLCHDVRHKLSTIGHGHEQLGALHTQIAEAEQAYRQAAHTLSQARRVAAKKLDKAVMAELPPLKLEHARFETRIEPVAHGHEGPDGVDDVVFLVATNRGSEAAPLGRIVSGGELSRFMLAIKLVFAATSPVPVMVFDEVDSGMGGATADAVGERLARLARAGRQVLVVTHSPQVAARANHHYVIAKSATKSGAVTTRVLPLPDAPARRAEIARMLAGATLTDEALAAAGKLLQQAS